MKLMIIESPGKIEKLSAILGDDWKIAASIGHVRDLPTDDIGVEAPDFAPKYEWIPGRPIPGKKGERYPSSKERIDRLKNLAQGAEQVYLATDPDREGESISWHLQQCLKLKNPLRVTFNEITANAVKASLAAPRGIDVKLVAAQEARRVLDRLVGYMVSPELCRIAGDRLSAGRVQSVALRLVVDRERQIRAFKVTNHFGAMLIFADAKTGRTWTAEWMTKPDFVTEDQPYFMDRDYALRVADVRAVAVKSSDEREARRGPPAPFTTSTMQQAASVALGMNPKAAMDAAQKLYEQGHITYHRTDNPNVSDDALGDIYAVAVKLGLDMADKPRKFPAPDGAQVGHPAITPTHWDVEEAGETEEQRALYKLIRFRAIACQLADARYAVRTARLEAVEPVGGRKVEFEAKGRTLTYPGWLKLTAGDQTEEDEGEAEPTNPIPMLDAGQSLDADSGKLLEKKTKPPARYTEASLVKKLEAEGIGRPSTYAAIMDNIVSRGYVRVEKKFMVPTETGETVVDAMVGRFEFMELGFTRELESELDRIAKGEAGYKSVVAKLHGGLQSEIASLQATAAPKFPCPECGKPLRRIPGKSGHFWGCTGHPDCSVTLPDEAGKPGQRKPLELSAFACPKCGKPLVHRVKKGKGGYDFWGCSGFRDGCKASYDNKNGSPDLAKAK